MSLASVVSVVRVTSDMRMLFVVRLMRVFGVKKDCGWLNEYDECCEFGECDECSECGVYGE